jgi:hypothetical protein
MPSLEPSVSPSNVRSRAKLFASALKLVGHVLQRHAEIEPNCRDLSTDVETSRTQFIDSIFMCIDWRRFSDHKVAAVVAALAKDLPAADLLDVEETAAKELTALVAVERDFLKNAREEAATLSARTDTRGVGVLGRIDTQGAVHVAK